MFQRRVAVTGTSVVTSLGCDVSDVWTQICDGNSGIRRIERFDCRQLDVQFGGEIRDFDASAHMQIDGKALRRMDRFVQFAMVAADKAIQQSGVFSDVSDPFRSGVLIGSCCGGLEEIEHQHTRLLDRGPERISAFLIPKLIVNAAAGNVAVHWQLQGPGAGISTADASSVHAIGTACRLIQRRKADVMIAGGTEAALTRMGIATFVRSQLLSRRNQDPASASRPFDADRDGIVMAEGAGLLVLEDMERAKNRGANILAEIRGFGLGSDDLTQPTDGNIGGPVRAMRAAMVDAETAPNEVDYINAHGCSSVSGDKTESLAIRHVFGAHADSTPVSSIKGQLGHLLGAAGAVEIVFCVKAMETKTVPPTINLQTPGKACDLDFVANRARDLGIRCILKNSFGFNGSHACVVITAASD